MTKKSFAFAMLMFVLGGVVYVIFDLYAPYCAKHVCGCSSGGWWMMLPNLSVIFLLIGFMTILLAVFDYEAPEKEEDDKTEFLLSDGRKVSLSKEQVEAISYPVDFDMDTFEEILEQFLHPKDGKTPFTLTKEQVACLSIIQVLQEMGYKTSEIYRMLLSKREEKR